MEPNPDAATADSLQFRTAEVLSEPASPACGLCKAPVGESYYHVSGVVACHTCAENRLTEQTTRGGVSHFGRAALFGLGAAVAGSIVWAIVAAVTHMEFAYLAIVIGYAVGKAVTYGARGCRGRRYQIVAVLLTYVSITTSYIPQFISDLRELEQKKSTTAVATQSLNPPPPASVPATQANSQPAPAPPGLAFAIAIVFLVILSFVAPFLGLTSGFGGVLNLLIIFFGLSRAWRYTKADDSVIMGPYSTAEMNAQAAS